MGLGGGGMIVDLTALPRKRREPEADRLVLGYRAGALLWIRTG